MIWTQKEINEEYAKQRQESPLFEELERMEPGGLILYEVKLPYTYITVDPGGGVRASEISKVNGTVKYVKVKQMLGAHDLVRASIFLNKTRIVNNIGGDDQDYTFLCADPIKKGDIVEVVIENSDESFPHTIGVRIDVDEGK